jgi:hypothetical protein
MQDFFFRLRFILPKTNNFNCGESAVILANFGDTRPLVLRALGQDKSIQDSNDFVLECFGWPTEIDAEQMGQVVRSAFMRSLARMSLAAEFGFRNPSGHITQHGKRWLEGVFGTTRVEHDVLGLSVFSASPPPQFVTLPRPTLTSPQPIDRLKCLFSRSLDYAEHLSFQEELSFGLYCSSFFAHSEDARFLNLMMAIEALLTPQPRAETAKKFVDQLIDQTKTNDMLSESDRQSLIGSLNWLRSESISHAGRRLVMEKLGNREYMEMRADRFFTHCYDLRSRLVHAATPLPTRDEVAKTVATLENFVAHMLSGALIEIEL